MERGRDSSLEQRELFWGLGVGLVKKEPLREGLKTDADK